MDCKGQSSAEFLLLMGFFIALLVVSSIFILEEDELNKAMIAARNGVNEGIIIDSAAVYPDDVYREYELSKENLLHPSLIKLENVNYTNMGVDSGYNKEKIQFKVTVSSSEIIDKDLQDSFGDRINYNLRKALAYTFNSENLTNELYNPVFSNHYVFTTANVKWIN